MKRTVSWNKRKFNACKTELSSLLNSSSINKTFIQNLRIELNNRKKKLFTIFKNRRNSKYRRDRLMFYEQNCDFELFTFPQVTKTPNKKLSLKERLIGDIEIPSHEPINLSNQPIDDDLKSLCSKGPSFIPTPNHVNWFQLLKDFDTFKHKIRTRAFYASQNTNQNENSTENLATEISPPYKARSSNNVAPCSKFNEIELFLSKIEKDLFQETQSRKIRSNLSIGERKALNEWQSNMDNPEKQTILRIQDKGNRFVLVDKDTDRKKATEQIQRSNFVEIQQDPTLSHIQVVKQFVQKWESKKQLSSKWSKFIINQNAQPGKNSTLYKTHKTGIPVRLLTTGCNTAIENLAIFVEKHCAPLAESISTRIKDTQHLLQIIDTLNVNGIPENAILVSFDIVNMFPSIDNEMGINAVRKSLQKRNTKYPSTECLIEALSICLTHNNSTFDGKHLLQTNGTAMGAANSCSYSDLAIEPIDSAVTNAMSNNFKELLYFGRYRDDCFSLWLGDRLRLNDFLQFINSIAPGIVFTMEIGGRQICFLDLKIEIVDNQLTTTVYCKPTNSLMYLHGNSCHPKPSKDGISLGVATRLRRICSTNEEFDVKATEYQAYLAARDHDTKAVKRNFQTVKNKTRAESRLKCVRNNDTPVTIFCSEHNPRGPNVRQIINKHLDIIYDSPTLSKIFPRNSIMVANRTLKNLKQLMVRADPYSNVEKGIDENPGYVSCKKCDSCKNFVDSVDSFTCQATKRKFTIKKRITCNTHNVIYMAYCLKCKQQGVGSTTKWKPRLSNYKSHVKTSNPTCCITRHFIECCRDPDNPHKYMRFVLIDYVGNAESLTESELENVLLHKEKFWIGTLCTIHKGMNGYHDWRRETRVQKFKIKDW